MKMITPAYSVISTIVVLAGIALAGLPASVFAQLESATSTEVDNGQQATETSGDDTEVTNNQAGTPIVTQKIVDTYKREQVQVERVFSDFVVGPGRFDLEIAPGESKTVEIIVTNRMGVTKTFSLTTEDMAGTDDPAVPVILLGDAVGPYSMKDFISVPHNRFVLKNGERVRVPVTVTLPADAEPGGFYGSLLTQIVSDDIAQEGGEVKPSSKVVSRIGTLFFVSTPGDIAHESAIKSFSTIGNKKFYTKGPISFNIVTENTGSVHVHPFGEIHITNTLGEEVGMVELEPWYILPNSIRSKEVKWDREFLAGRYTVTATINRGYDDIVDEVSYTLWVIPVKLVLGILSGLFILFILLRFIFSQFEFKRKTR